jgi:DNA-binding winged helix-turn-helix (wHTH) protein/Tol biopolymer transport system component
MSPFTPTSPRLRFGVFELDPAAGQLQKNSTLIKLPPQPFRLLLLLTERAGTVVTREEIRTNLWTDSTFIDFEHGINFSINQIRAVLADNADKPRYIETLPRRGYRFIAAVEHLNGKNSLPRRVEPVERPSTIDTATFQFPPIFFDPGINKPVVDVKAGPASQPLCAPEFGPQQSWIASPKLRFAGIAFLSALVLLAVWAVYHSPRFHPEVTNPLSMEVRRLAETGGIGNAAISPDGRFVVYSRSVNGRWSLRLHDLSADGDAEILPPDGSTPVALAFSADGAHIYFTRDDNSYSGYHRLFVMPSLGGPVRALLEDVDSPPSLSPDGRQFNYTRGKPTKNLVEVRIADADGSGDHLLAAIPESSSVISNGATWSPDGRTIAVGINHEGLEFDSALYAISVANATPRRIFTSDAIMGRPAWLPPAGTTLLVPLLDRLTGRSQLWIVTYPDGRIRRLTNDLSNYALTVDLSRDGKTAVTVEKNIASEIWTSTNGKPQRLDQATSGGGPMLEAVELPGGNTLIRGQTDVWSFDPQSRARTPFAKLTADSFRACGKYVVINALQQGVRRLLRFDLDGRNPTVLDSDNINSLACSPDGQFVFYSVRNSPQKILRVSIQGGVPTEVFRTLNADLLGPLDVSHDGRYIVFCQTAGVPATQIQFVVISTAGGPVLKTVAPASDLLAFDIPLRWSADDRAIQYTVDHSGVTNVWQQPLAGGSPEQLTNFSSGKIFGFNWSLNGKRLLLGHGAVTSDIVLFSHLR